MARPATKLSVHSRCGISTRSPRKPRQLVLPTLLLPRLRCDRKRIKLWPVSTAEQNRQLFVVRQETPGFTALDASQLFYSKIFPISEGSSKEDFFLSPNKDLKILITPPLIRAHRTSGLGWAPSIGRAKLPNGGTATRPPRPLLSRCNGNVTRRAARPPVRSWRARCVQQRRDRNGSED